MKFTKSELCKTAGISQETLRHYIDKNLLAPHDISVGGRSYYSIDEVAQVMNARYLRSMDFSITELQDMRRHQTDLAHILSGLSAKKEELLQKRAALDIALSYLDYRTSTFQKKMGGEWYQEGCVKVYRNYPTIAAFYDGTPESAERVRVLSNCYPCAFPAIRLPVYGEVAEGEPSIGICLMDNWAERFPDLVTDDFTVYGELRLYTILRVKSISETTPADFSMLLDYADKHNFKVVSDIIGEILYYTSSENGEECTLLAGVVIE